MFHRPYFHWTVADIAIQTGMLVPKVICECLTILAINAAAYEPTVQEVGAF